MATQMQSNSSYDLLFSLINMYCVSPFVISTGSRGTMGSWGPGLCVVLCFWGTVSWNTLHGHIVGPCTVNTGTVRKTHTALSFSPCSSLCSVLSSHTRMTRWRISCLCYTFPVVDHTVNQCYLWESSLLRYRISTLELYVKIVLLSANLFVFHKLIR